jgi:hypothetical protein
MLRIRTLVAGVPTLRSNQQAKPPLLYSITVIVIRKGIYF